MSAPSAVIVPFTLMRIPDDIEDLVLAFMEPDAKKALFKMTREEIDQVITGEIPGLISAGYVEPAQTPGCFPFRVTRKGKDILAILAPCKRSGR